MMDKLVATLESLPVELLQSIFYHLSNRDGRPTPWLLVVASQSRKLRQAALPFLFQSMSLSFDRSEDDQVNFKRMIRPSLSDFLTAHPHVASHVKSIDVRSTQGKSTDLDELDKFKAILPTLTGLKLIRFRSFDYKVMMALRELHLDCGVAIDMYSPIVPKDRAVLGDADPLCSMPNVVSLSIVTRQISVLKQVLKTHKKLQRLAFLTPVNDPSRFYRDLSDEHYDMVKDETYSVPPITELRLDGLLGNQASNEPDDRLYVNERIAFLNNIQWHVIRSLSLNGGEFIHRFLTHYGDRLRSIRHLSLWVYDDSNTNPFGDHKGGVEATEHFLHTSDCARQLRSLELRGYSLKFSFTCIESPKLESLRFHNYEHNSRPLSSFVRAASDIRHLAQQCPELCHLAIDFPHMNNMFHPSAIPGVDADVTVYPFLQAISEIPYLSHLHIFPPYTQTKANHTTYAQPVTNDDLVIQLFKHIRTYQNLYKQNNSSPESSSTPVSSYPSPPTTPSRLATPTKATLRHLLISSDNLFSKWVAPFDPQSWAVSEPTPGRFFMTTRQAGREYEQRQVWEGRRKLRTEIRRDRHPRHYEGGFADGTGVGWWGMP